MPNFIVENPKAVATAIVGVILFVVKKYFFEIPPEINMYVDMILGTAIVGLLGRFTRITKSEAQVLNTVGLKERDHCSG
jgi:hypothetical protein